MTNKKQKEVPVFSLTSLVDRKVKIGRIGKSKLSTPEEIQQTRDGVEGLTPELIERYAGVADAIQNAEWQGSAIQEELAVLAEAVLGTGSVERGASSTARRAREIVVKAAGDAMVLFPRTIMGLTHLANHALYIGLLREPARGEKALMVELPTGDVTLPTWRSLMCPWSKPAALVTNYIGMAKEARAEYTGEQKRKIAEMQPSTHTFLSALEQSEGETVCYSPRIDLRPAMYLAIKIEGGYITVQDAAGDPLAETLIGYWVPLDAVTKTARLSARIRSGLLPEQEKTMTLLLWRLRDGILYAQSLRAARVGRLIKADAASTSEAPTSTTPPASSSSSPATDTPVPVAPPAAETEIK